MAGGFFPEGHFPEGYFPDGYFPESDDGGSATPPVQFYFETRFKADLSTQYESSEAEILGLTAPSISTVANGEQRINGGEWTSAPLIVSNGDALQVRRDSSDTPGAQAQATATIEGVVGVYVIVTDEPAPAAERPGAWKRRAVIPYQRRAA